MKRIIDGKLYNTDTAEFIGEASNTWRVSDYSYYHEELYRTKKGSFFLYGKGNGASKYRSYEGDGFGPGEKIVPCSVEDAKHWVENHMSPEDYEEVFGAVEEA